jgi:hypothetical protein
LEARYCCGLVSSLHRHNNGHSTAAICCPALWTGQLTNEHFHREQQRIQGPERPLSPLSRKVNPSARSAETGRTRKRAPIRAIARWKPLTCCHRKFEARFLAPRRGHVSNFGTPCQHFRTARMRRLNLRFPIEGQRLIVHELIDSSARNVYCGARRGHVSNSRY